MFLYTISLYTHTYEERNQGYRITSGQVMSPVHPRSPRLGLALDTDIHAGKTVFGELLASYLPLDGAMSWHFVCHWRREFNLELAKGKAKAAGNGHGKGER